MITMTTVEDNPNGTFSPISTARPRSDITLDVPASNEQRRPPISQHLSSSAYQSPLRHHQRGASQHRVIKETLNAKSAYMNNEEDGKGEHHINQYIIKEEIGRGSFGAVHLAVDQYGTEYAVKEFSKSRLRKRAQSNILRRTPGQRRRPGNLAASSGLNAPLHRHSASDLHDEEASGNSLYLIKEEIAIMKKLNHPNLVSLIEVLDDPDEDSLYMVMEMCKKGVIMKVGLEEKADPYDSENSRCWFRDLILGVEYLHAQGVVHRDIKPDNLLLTEDDVLKIVDFGVSEMFEKQSEMITAKSAGSPAFLPPELCVTKHGDVSGKAADIWSMGVSLYCLRFGKIPFERPGVLELYEAIRHDAHQMQPDSEPEFKDLMDRLLEKDPSKRITIAELREHSWVTRNGQDPLLSAEENIANLVEPPSKTEVNHAITVKMKHLIIIMEVVQKFKSLLEKKRKRSGGAGTLSNSLSKGVLETDLSSQRDDQINSPSARSRISGVDGGGTTGNALATEGAQNNTHSSNIDERPKASSAELGGLVTSHPGNISPVENKDLDDRPHGHDGGEKGHAHDPLGEEPLYLGIGSGGGDSDNTLDVPSQSIVAESPTAADFSIYDTAYSEEVERIRSSQGHTATVYLTRRVDGKKEYKADENMIEVPETVSSSDGDGMPREGWKGYLDRAREKHDNMIKQMDESKGQPVGFRHKFEAMARQAVENTRKLADDTKKGGSDILKTFSAKGKEQDDAQ